MSGLQFRPRRRASVANRARRALSAAISAPRSSALKRIERRCSARVLRAITTRTRVRAGHGKCTVVVSAAWAWPDPSVATKTRSSVCLPISWYSAVSHRSVSRCRLSIARQSHARVNHIEQTGTTPPNLPRHSSVIRHGPVASVQDVTDEQFVQRITPLTQIRL